MSNDNKKTAPSENKHQPSATTAGATPANASDTEAKNANEATAGEVNTEETEWAPPRSIERHLRRKRQLQSGVPIITVTVSLVALLVIIAQAIIYNQQRQIMHRQVEITEEGLHVSERAYVGVASLTANLAQGQVLILLENSGKIPAKNISVEAKEYRVTANLVGSKTKFDAGPVSLFPGSYKMRVIVRMSKFKSEEIPAIQARKESLIVAGKIEYEDGFGLRVSNEFAFEYSPPTYADWTAMSTWPAEIEPVLESRAYSVSQNNGLTIVSAQSPDMRPSLGSKPYGRPPNQSWTPISTPLADIRPGLGRTTYSPTPSNIGTPIGAATAETKPSLAKKTSAGGSCACSCAWICSENICQFELVGCGLSEGVTAAEVCCEAARKAACPNQ